MKRIDTKNFNLENVTIAERVEIYSKTASGKNWKRKPDEKRYSLVDSSYYQNICDSVPFFNDRVEYGYTYAGYIPVKFTAVSPDGKTKVIRYFWIVNNVETLRNDYNLPL